MRTLRDTVIAACLILVPQASGQQASPVDVDQEYGRHINFMADPALGGRYPGTRGIESAARYIEQHFRSLGLEPAFADEGGAASFRQPFEVGKKSEVATASLGIAGGRMLTPGEDFNALGYSNSGSGELPAVFIGYGIAAGPAGYLGFPPGTDLNGKVAIVARFEPMDSDGTSKWIDDGWSFNAGLLGKFRAAANRGAKAVILVTPPNADDPRVNILDTLEETRQAQEVGIPVYHAKPNVVNRIIRQGDTEGRSLSKLLELANEEGTVIDLPDVRVAFDVSIDREPIVTSNIGGVLRGRSELADEYVVIGSHYDHVGLGVIGTSSPGELHPGADDNASGTSGTLTAATILKNTYDALPDGQDARSVLFLAFSAEESGLIGSAYYGDNPIAPLDRHELMLNMDMIGSLNERLEVGGVGSGEGLQDLVAPVFADAQNNGIDISTSVSIGSGRSDHASFDRRDVPNLFFFTGITPTYHSPGDTIETLNLEGAADITEMVAEIARLAALNDDDMSYVDTSGSRRGAASPGPTRLKVRVGIAPGDYSGRGGGVLVGAVTPGTSADDAGLKKDDRILTWNGTEVPTVNEWMPLLMQAEPGEVVKMQVLRAGEEITVEMKLKPAATSGG
ncbi:MAG: M28 family peptidase [Planctomycetota bacterium]